MKIAITGATGHIGANMVFKFAKKGWQIRAVYRDRKKIEIFNSLNIEKKEGDILDRSFLRKAFAGMDAVIHLAGKISIDGDPDGSVMKTNVEGVRSVVAACLENNIEKLIHFSSVHALKYTHHSPIVNEESPYADQYSFLYDQSKALGELEVRKGIQQGLDAYILNPTAVIGGHDYFSSKTGELFTQLFTGKMPFLIKGGFNWVDVGDLVDTTLFILENGAPNRRYLLGGHFATFAELASMCEEVSGTKKNRFVLPIEWAFRGLPFIRFASKFLNKEPLYTYESLMIVKNANQNYSSELAKKDLGYEPRPLKKSITDLYEWWKNHPV